MLQLPHDELARVRRTRSDVSFHRSPNNTALSTTARQTYTTELKTLTSTGSSEGSVSTDEAQSSPIPTAVAPETLKQKPKVPPNPSKRHGVFLETADLAQAQVCLCGTRSFSEKLTTVFPQVSPVGKTCHRVVELPFTHSMLFSRRGN